MKSPSAVLSIFSASSAANLFQALYADVSTQDWQIKYRPRAVRVQGGAGPDADGLRVGRAARGVCGEVIPRSHSSPSARRSASRREGRHRVETGVGHTSSTRRGARRSSARRRRSSSIFLLAEPSLTRPAGFPSLRFQPCANSSAKRHKILTRRSPSLRGIVTKATESRRREHHRSHETHTCPSRLHRHFSSQGPSSADYPRQPRCRARGRWQHRAEQRLGECERPGIQHCRRRTRADFQRDRITDDVQRERLGDECGRPECFSRWLAGHFVRLRCGQRNGWCRGQRKRP